MRDVVYIRQCTGHKPSFLDCTHSMHNKVEFDFVQHSAYIYNIRIRAQLRGRCTPELRDVFRKRKGGFNAV